MKFWSNVLKVAEPITPFTFAKALTIDNQEQLDLLEPKISSSLSATYGIEVLADKICPVLRSDGTVTIFARQEYVSSDQADALVRRILASGKGLSDPSRYILPAGLLLSLTRKNKNSLQVKTGRSTPTALIEVFHDLLKWAIEQKATDIHFNIDKSAPTSEVRFTVLGRYICPERYQNMSSTLLFDMLSVVWMDIQGGNGAVFDPLVEQQGVLSHSVGGKTYILRWASLAADTGPSVCLRILTKHEGGFARSLLSLGYSSQQLEIFARVLLSDAGAIVLAGTVGSGKSTSLASLIGNLPDYRKVITLEEPVEYRINNAVQNNLSRDLGTLAHKQYAAKLRTLKRSAMTDVLLGEIRDQESGLAFMDLAGSGVNIYTTVHAPSAGAIVDRLASEFIGIPRDFLLTPGILKLLVYQALLPQLCANCAHDITAFRKQKAYLEQFDYFNNWLSWIERYWLIKPDVLRFRNELGCSKCYIKQLPQLAGYKGRTVVAEMLEPGLINLINNTQQVYLPDINHSAMGHAMQKAAMGLIDVRDIEMRFVAIKTLALRSGWLGG